tara:strand:- start:95 stop:334 length:240 start_codon:yes stop_codon:yes gene_type:complete
MHQDYDNMPSELISVAELWQEEINKITHALEYLKLSKEPADQRLRWKYEIIIEYLKQRVKEEMQGIPPKTSPREKRTLH